jgi:hypothetical protein
LYKTVSHVGAEKLGEILRAIQIPDYILASLQESLAHDHKQMSNNSAAQRSALQQHLAALRHRMDQAYHDKLDAKIPENFWERRMREWSDDEQGIQEALARVEEPVPQRLLTAHRTLELASF